MNEKEDSSSCICYGIFWAPSVRILSSVSLSQVSESCRQTHRHIPICSQTAPVFQTSSWRHCSAQVAKQIDNWIKPGGRRSGAIQSNKVVLVQQHDFQLVNQGCSGRSGSTSHQHTGPGSVTCIPPEASTFSFSCSNKRPLA